MAGSRLKYLFSALSAAAIWGFISIPMRNMHQHSPEQILYYRVLTSLLIVWFIILVFRRHIAKLSYLSVKNLSKKERSKTIALALGAGVFITLNWFTFIYVINHVSLQSGVFAYLVCPIITALCGFVLLKEHLTKLKFFAIALALISITVMATGSYLEVAWSVAVALTYAAYLIIQRVLLYIDKFTMLGLQLAISTLLLIPFFIGRHEPIPTALNFWANTLALSVIFTIIPLFLSMYALTALPSSTVGITIYINPIIAFCVAILYFHEHVDGHKLWGYLLLLGAVILFNWNVLSEAFKRKQPQITEPVS